MILLTGYQTPAALRRIGPNRLAIWLKNREVRGAQAPADAAVAAAQAQHTAVAGEATTAVLASTLAKTALALDEEIASIDLKIADRFREHRDAEVIVSMPGTGPLLGAKFIACTGGDMDAFGVWGALWESPVSHRAGSAGTCADHTATIDDSCACSTHPPRSAPASAPADWPQSGRTAYLRFIAEDPCVVEVHDGTGTQTVVSVPLDMGEE
ncbi:hypothetical protein ACFTXM_32235 [Streptomyces sp. NPDC056930]|uniref:hypothetical protein n=1 Tax=Streptomyces sp. NPDC056930 TaxID=3345967 RepID=UPI003636670E